MIENIRKQLVVAASADLAFEVFTQKIDLWWPRSHHIGKTPMTKTVIEAGLNGRWYSLHEDGSRCEIGFVIEWNPPHKLVLAWQINAQFAYDPSIVSEIEILFIAEAGRRTRVEFEHRNLDRLGEGPKIVESMDAGWGKILALYVALCAKS